MKNITIKFASFLFFTLSIALPTMGQSGIYPFITNNSLYPNSKVIDVVEFVNNEIYLLCENADADYKETQLALLGVDTQGKLMWERNIEQANLYNAIRIIKGASANRESIIFGNTTLNKNLSPFSIRLNNKKEVIDSRNFPSVFSTYISDLYVWDKETALLAFTTKGKDNLYGVELQKINTTNNKLIWLKTVSESKNEEAEQVVVSKNDEIFILGKKYSENLKEYVPIIYKLTETGNLNWYIELDVPSNFYNQSLSIDANGNVIYVCGYTKAQTGNTETRILKLDKNGKILVTHNEKDFNVNGILKLSNGKFLLYGSEFSVDLKQVVTKGKYMIISDEIEVIETRALTKNDKPDSELSGERITSSDFLTAIELSDNRILIGGRVYMPGNGSTFYNQPLIVILSDNGKL